MCGETLRLQMSPNLLIMGPWANYFTSLCLSFLTSKVRKTVAPPPQDNLRV